MDVFSWEGVTNEELRDREEEGLYPPKFCLSLTCFQGHAAPDGGKIMIKGTRSGDFEYDLHFENLRTGGLLGC